MRDSKMVVLVTALAIGCAPSPAPLGADGGTVVDPDGGTVIGGERDGGGSASRYECCIDGSPYRCPDEAAFDQCTGGFDPSCFEGCMTPECFDACIEMMEMSEPDPAACFSDATVTCEPVGGSCTPGPACDYDGDCTSDNCTDRHCYANAVGSPCEYDGDCTSDSCTDGTCS